MQRPPTPLFDSTHATSSLPTLNAEERQARICSLISRRLSLPSHMVSCLESCMQMGVLTCMRFSVGQRNIRLAIRDPSTSEIFTRTFNHHEFYLTLRRMSERTVLLSNLDLFQLLAGEEPTSGDPSPTPPNSPIL